MAPEHPEDREVPEFSDFFKVGYPKVVAVLRNMGFGLEEAADSAAEAMIQLLTAPGLINNPLAWVTKIAFRDAARNARRTKVGVEKAILAARREPRTVQEEPSGQLDDFFINLLGKITPGPRQVIALYYQGFETYEIADILSTKESTVRSHRRHARRQLNRLIADDLYAEVSGEFNEFLTLLQAKEAVGRD